MHNWKETLAVLADDEVTLEEPNVFFARRGDEYLVSLKTLPGAGLCVDPGDGEFVPFETYVQRDVLRLDRLAIQIAKKLEENSKLRPVPYIEGPSEVTSDGKTQTEEQPSSFLSTFVAESYPGSTKLLQLMANAGQGKTVLLEHVAMDLARRYTPQPAPVPLLLPVDLLGRFVGNIDDAIAGTLNNTFTFPHLTQGDVILAMKNRWLALALDGFDELVSRVGARDAFNRINDLLDQLEGNGAIVLSARSNFFELYQISSAIRSYLKPRLGTFSSSVLNLTRWTDKEGRNVFAALESPNPAQDFQAVKQLFENDESVIHQPFLLTRIADLWVRKDERFEEARGIDSSFARLNLALGYFLRREAEDKWKDRNDEQLISVENHYRLLSGLAEEMWRAQAFSLDVEELRLSVELSLADHVDKAVLAEVREKAPLHAALSAHGKRYAFINDQFLYFFLSWRLAELMLAGDDEGLATMFSASEVSPLVVHWTHNHFKAGAGTLANALSLLNSIATESQDTLLRTNVGSVASEFLRHGHDEANEVVTSSLDNLIFMGDVLAGASLQYATFRKCSFWNVDLSGASVQDCEFAGCEFGRIRVDNNSSFAGSNFSECSFASIETPGEAHYAPEAVAAFLRTVGANVSAPEDEHAHSRPQVRADSPAILAIDKMIRLSMQTWEFTASDLEGKVPSDSVDVTEFLAKAAECGVLNSKSKSTSGPHKTFYKFDVDRESVLAAQTTSSSDLRVECFWEYLSKAYPPRD